MAYHPKPGAHKWRRTVTDARDIARQQRELILAIAKGGMSREQMFQHLTAIGMLNARIGEYLEYLLEFRSETEDEET